jgi:hypothetical protein
MILPGWQSILLATMAALFAVFVVWRYRPRRRGRRRGAAPSVRIGRARERVRAATAPRDKAEALLAAGDIAIEDGMGATSAVGYYLRAMRADPVWPDPILRLEKLLERRDPDLLESLLWRRAAHPVEEERMGPSERAALEGLIALYARNRITQDRANALRLLLLAKRSPE